MLLANTLPDLTFISIGHRHTLRQFHTFKLTLDDLGDWQVTPIENNQDRSLKITGIVV